MKIPRMLRESISWKFTCVFVSLILCLLLAMLLANTFLLERYYTKEKIKVLRNAYTALDEMISAAGEAGIGMDELFPLNYDSSDPSTETEATRLIRSLTESNNISVIILDTKTDRSFSSSVNSDFMMKKLAEYIFGNRKNTGGKIVEHGENYSIERNLDHETERGYLESWGYFNDNTTSFIMSMPLASLRESAEFFNRFLLLIGAAAMLLGSVVAGFTSRAITRPINALAKLSEKMSRLDFSARYTGDAGDEIGTLGKSMNILSERLESSIAELKTANNELQSDIENKTKIDQRRQEFVANVSHELKTPIALIQGYAEGLQDGLAEDPASRDYYCSVIMDEARKMNRMVRELMNLSALEQGKDIPDISLFNLSRVVKGVLASSEILIRQKDARVELDIPEDLRVWADEFKLEAVVTNYLSNALHHLKAPNQISIYTENGADFRVTLHVVNTGDPIPEEELPRLWEKFYKVDKAHTRAYGGSGLGLSIVKAIAEAHHQSCGVRNTRTGVDFWFTLDREGKLSC